MVVQGGLVFVSHMVGSHLSLVDLATLKVKSEPTLDGFGVGELSAMMKEHARAKTSLTTEVTEGPPARATDDVEFPDLPGLRAGQEQRRRA